MKALYSKECREHAAAFLIMFVLELIVVGLCVVGVYARDRGSCFAALPPFLLFGLMPACVFLSHRLVAQEYSGKSHIFLQSLPVSRAQIFWAKWSLNLAAACVTAGAAFVFCLAAAARTEFITALSVTILLARTFAFVLFVCSMCFAFNFLGRYRIACALFFLVCAVFLDSITELNLSEQGPLFLIMDNRFAFERDSFPASDIAITLGLSAGFIVLSLGMALVREGSIAARLGASMSHREKLFFASMIISSLVLVSIFDERKEKKPFELPGSYAIRADGVSVEVQESSPEGLRSAAEWVHGELRDMKDYLGIDSLPPVFITLRCDLDYDKYERGFLRDAEGILVRINYDAEKWDRKDFLVWLVPKVLSRHTEGRALLEKNQWILDGFSVFWRLRGSEGIGDRERALLRAIHGCPDGLDRGTLDRWHSFSEHVGEDVARACAWFGLDLLERTRGADAARSLCREMLGVKPPVDFRALLREKRRPLEVILSQLAGESYNTFITRWNVELARAKQLRKDSLSGLPLLAGEVRIVRHSSSTASLEFHLTDGHGLEEATPIQLKYQVLSVENPHLTEHLIAKEELRVRDEESWHTLPKSYSPGTRIAWTFVARSKALQCRVISGWRRQEL